MRDTEQAGRPSPVDENDQVLRGDSTPLYTHRWNMASDPKYLAYNKFVGLAVKCGKDVATIGATCDVSLRLL
jgi:hypothetical protein